MENAEEIRKKIKRMHIKQIILFSAVVMVMCVLEYCVLTSETMIYESMGCFLLSVLLIDTAVVAVINMLVSIMAARKPDSFDILSLMFSETICHIFLYIVTVIFLIVKRIRPDNKGMILLGILLSAIIVVILELITWYFYIYMNTMSRLYYYSYFLDSFYKSYEENIQNYNSYARRYNYMYRDLSKIAEQLNRKVPIYKEVEEYKPEPVPQYNVSDIHLLYCAFGTEYIKRVDNYISCVKKELEKAKKCIANMEIALNQKEEYIRQLKINSDRLDNSVFSEMQKEIFFDVLKMGYDNNKKSLKKSIFERKIKPLREVKRDE